MSAPAAPGWGIVGHDAAVERLADAIALGHVPHALLITGPPGVGRTALALALSRALNCEAPASDRPCSACGNCRRILRGVHPDVTVVDMAWQDQVIPQKNRSEGAAARRRLSIDAVRWLRTDIVSRPMQGRWKVQIIDDAALLSDIATDAFLKTLEEPPPFAIIVLIAESEDDVSETILSRCRVISLSPVPKDVIASALVERGAAPEQADRLAAAARGRAGWALLMASDSDRHNQHRARVAAAFELMSDPLQRVRISGVMARDYSKKRDETLTAIDDWTGLWRDALLCRLGLSDRIGYPEVAPLVADYAARFDTADLYRALWATRRCASDLDANVNARAALHAMVMQWPD